MELRLATRPAVLALLLAICAQVVLAAPAPGPVPVPVPVAGASLSQRADPNADPGQGKTAEQQRADFEHEQVRHVMLGYRRRGLDSDDEGGGAGAGGEPPLPPPPPPAAGLKNLIAGDGDGDGDDTDDGQSDGPPGAGKSGARGGAKGGSSRGGGVGGGGHKRAVADEYYYDKRDQGKLSLGKGGGWSGWRFGSGSHGGGHGSSGGSGLEHGGPLLTNDMGCLGANGM
ncbi:hypothetical protein KEM52_002843 [Ascosphaera acerosa]|nr:hypothetical protein KEM52_002843 [Ascosphaera acerosa]